MLDRTWVDPPPRSLNLLCAQARTLHLLQLEFVKLQHSPLSSTPSEDRNPEFALTAGNALSSNRQAIHGTETIHSTTKIVNDATPIVQMNMIRCTVASMVRQL